MAAKKKTPAQLKVEADARKRAESAKKRSPDLATSIVRTNYTPKPKPAPKKKTTPTNPVKQGADQLADAMKAFWGPRIPIIQGLLGKKKKK